MISVSCKKNTTSNPVTINSYSESLPPLVFEKLNVDDTIVKVQKKIIIRANATGDGLTYTWSGSYLAPSDSSSVFFVICHAARTKITCKIKDIHNQTATREIYMVSQDL